MAELERCVLSVQENIAETAMETSHDSLETSKSTESLFTFIYCLLFNAAFNCLIHNICCFKCSSRIHIISIYVLHKMLNMLTQNAIILANLTLYVIYMTTSFTVKS